MLEDGASAEGEVGGGWSFVRAIPAWCASGTQAE